MSLPTVIINGHLILIYLMLNILDKLKLNKEYHFDTLLFIFIYNFFDK